MKALSGAGIGQWTAIGRAIVRRPKVLLVDEPLSVLDAALGVEMHLELSRLHERLGTTMITVTQDQKEAMALAEGIAVFNLGKIEQVGEPLKLYNEPANKFVAEFIGPPKINVFDAVFEKDSSTNSISGFGDLSFASCGITEKQAKSGIALGILAENLDITMDSETDSLKGVLDLVERLDDLIVAYIRSLSDQVSQVVTVEQWEIFKSVLVIGWDCDP